MSENYYEVMDIIHAYCGRIFSQGNYDEYTDGDGTETLLSHQFPILSVNSLEVDGEVIEGYYSRIANWNKSLGELEDSASFILYAPLGLLRLKSGVFPRGKKNVRLQYTAGYATIPKDIEQVSIELVAGAKIEERPDIKRVLDLYKRYGY